MIFVSHIIYIIRIVLLKAFFYHLIPGFLLNDILCEFHGTHTQIQRVIWTQTPVLNILILMISGVKIQIRLRFGMLDLDNTHLRPSKRHQIFNLNNYKLNAPNQSESKKSEPILKYSSFLTSDKAYQRPLIKISLCLF